MIEAGIDSHIAMQWNGLFAPAKTAQPILDKLYREMVKAIGDADVKQRFAAEGASPVGSSPSEFAAYFRTEAATWADVAKRSGTLLD